ncbi:hypothetical protein EUBDOL_00630 [Amedibacillus dolichus DSM 3991]|uniref:Uncharacterized protein n=1 Tax=Amedibacillus dolichus DSM 3991 TaxID=428127 RepID=A8R9W4_9FIRM|nr:hypothetical protein EUBDOL_00630 [Amedibacillus dolichus DSM 3991]
MKITPSTSRGKEMHKVIISTLIPVMVEKIIHKPVIPPGANPVNEKIKFTAMAVSIAEIVIHKKS